MPRQSRKYTGTSFFHVIVQGLNKEYIFKKQANISKYLGLIEKYKEGTNIEIIAYCIMNNHAHFLIFSDKNTELSKFMKRVNTAYAKYYNEKNNRVGYVFRDRFLSEEICDERYFIKCINYIHNNPVKANIVVKPEQYKYSSYKEFITGKKCKQLLRLTGIKFDIEQFKEQRILEYFIDVDTDIKELIENGILQFCIDNGLHLVEILENRLILKKLIRCLNDEYKIKYTEIMEVFSITKNCMESLK